VWRRTFLSTEAVAFERVRTEKRSLLPTPLDIKDAGRIARTRKITTILTV
jgi:hypothetical protein